MTHRAEGESINDCSHDSRQIWGRSKVRSFHEWTVATIQTDLGLVQADVSDLQGDLPVDMTPAWAAAVLALIAAVGVICVVIRMRKPAS